MVYSNTTGYPSVTQMLDPWVDKQWFTDEHRDRGTAVHAAVAAELKNLFCPALPPAWQPYLDSALRWIDEHVDQVILVEERLVDPHRGYCGQPDLLCVKKDGMLTLVDWKTAQAYASWWALQIAGYRYLIATSEDLNVDQALTIRLKKDGSGVLVNEHQDYAHHLNIFMSSVNTYHYFN